MSRNSVYFRTFSSNYSCFIVKLFLLHLISSASSIFHDPKPAAFVKRIFQGILDLFSGKVGVFERGAK